MDRFPGQSAGAPARSAATGGPDPHDPHRRAQVDLRLSPATPRDPSGHKRASARTGAGAGADAGAGKGAGAGAGGVLQKGGGESL